MLTSFSLDRRSIKAGAFQAMFVSLMKDVLLG